MTIDAWRIVKTKHSATEFSGNGAKTYGGRWNSPGVAVVYVSGSMSLALLETLVHIQSEDLLKHRYLLYKVTFNDSLVTAVDPATLPKNWRKSPSPARIQQIGDLWVARAKSAILQVPSPIVPTEWNYLLNPAHPNFTKITIAPNQPVQFDPRLIKTPIS